MIAKASDDLDGVVSSFRQWLKEHRADLKALETHPAGDVSDAISHAKPALRALYDAGWTRFGWPESVGGIGGTAVQRAAVYEALSAAGYVVPDMLGTIEIIGPMLVRFAPELAAAAMPPALRAEEMWCQGFSEPEAGSDLAGLRTRAIADGEGFILNGQKMWSSFGHAARRCSLLARTGEADSRHRGLTMFWVDLEASGITVVPTACSSGRNETSEIFLDDVRVPASALIGPVGGGWDAVMYLMQFERGAYAWLRQGAMHSDFERLLGRARDVPAVETVGTAYLSMFALRSLAAATVARLAAGIELGPEISVDKIMMGLTEQVVADAARELIWPDMEIADDFDSAVWRRNWSFSRITTIYGGTIDVQRDLVAERLLGLPRGR